MYLGIESSTRELGGDKGCMAPQEEHGNRSFRLIIWGGRGRQHRYSSCSLGGSEWIH